MTSAIFMLALRQAAAPRRAVMLALLALLPLGLAALISGLGNPGGGDLIAAVLQTLIVFVVMPIVVTVLATSAFGNEVEDRTLSLLTTKPVPRWSIVLAKLAATVIVAAPMMMAVSAVVTMMDPDGSGMAATAAAAGTLVGVVTYASAFTWAGLVTTRALGFALIYILLWESIITSFLEGTRYLSVRSYTMGTMHGLDEITFSEVQAVDFQAALGGAAIVTVLFFFLSVRRLSRMDIP